MRVLGIESSCDELAMAVLDHDGRTLLANVVHSRPSCMRNLAVLFPKKPRAITWST